MSEEEKIEIGEEDIGHAITDARLKSAASMAVAGASKGEIKKSLQLSVYGVNKLYKDDRFKQLVEQLGEDSLITAKAVTRVQISKLAAKSIKALEHNLDKNSLEAVKVVLRSMGIDEENKENKKDGAFTLVLASGKPEPQTIQVVKEDDEP